MKTLQKLLALLLVAVLCVALLAACASDKQGSTTPDNDAEGSTNDPENEEEDYSALSVEDADVLEFYMIDINTSHANDQAVMDAVNAITVPAIGAAVHITYMDMGTYGTQLSMAISGGEQVDIANFSYVSPWAAYTANGQAMPLDDLLAEYGQDIMAVAGPYMEGMKVGGVTYGVPVLRNNISDAYFTYNSAVSDELGINMDEVKTWAQLEEVFERIKNETEMYPIGGSRGLVGELSGFFDPENIAIDMYDPLGDPLYLLYGAENNTVGSVQENELNVNKYKMLADWNEKGYVYPDTLTNQEMNSSMLQGQGIIFCQFGATEIGAKVSYQQQTGLDTVEPIKIGSGVMNSSSFTIWPTMIPVTAAYPEKAMQFINLCYTNEELMNTLIYGIEGVNYVLTENGEAAYPEGADPVSCGYHMGEWIFGNAFLLKPWAGNGPDFQAEAKAALESAEISPYMGFAVDSANLTDTIAALTATTDQYRFAMQSGMYTEAMYNEFIDTLYAAGLQTYIDEYQSQLDAWVASK